jgi:carboxyl-terminal processing protease
MSLRTRGILVLVIGTTLGLSLSLGSALLKQQQSPLPEDLTWEQARLFAEVMERVKRDYVDPIDDETLVESAIRGMVSDLDRHSQYLDVDEYEDIRISTTGSYSGVGIEVSTVDDSIVVVAPIDDTPAQRAGIQSGDEIVAIDGIMVDTENLNHIIGKMRGRAGSHVVVSVAREDKKNWLVFSLTRELIKVASVRQEVLEPEFGYLRISQFTDSTADEVSTAIDQIMDEVKGRTGQMLGGLVLDLRNNPGGILDAAVDVSDLFLDSGVIVTADGRTPESRFTRDASRGDILDGAAMVVLVNEGSASASEIVAGALQDHNRALILGTSTFGKGLVQTVMPLSKGRAIKLTTSRYYTPSGDSIHEVGIEPDLIVEGSPGFPGLGMNTQLDPAQDDQLTEAIDTLRNQRVMHSDASAP